MKLFYKIDNASVNQPKLFKSSRFKCRNMFDNKVDKNA